MMSKFWIRFGAFSGITACLFEIGIEFYAASKNPEYSSISQSISFLGNQESPTYLLMQTWSVVFSMLFVFFAYGFYQAFKSRFNNIKWATFLLVIYGFGQGLGAGLFPADALRVGTTWVNHLHDLFSGLGDSALVLFPLVMLCFFVKEQRFFTMVVSVLGFSFVLLFLMAKFQFVQQTAPYKGLWQRLFQGVYYTYFLFVAYKMVFNNKRRMK